jgi:hypothetical protein
MRATSIISAQGQVRAMTDGVSSEIAIKASGELDSETVGAGIVV